VSHSRDGRASPQVAYVTYPGDDDERAPTVAALRAAGLDAAPLRWDDPEVDWSGVGLALVRSTWDYTERRTEFLSWAERTATLTTLLNPAPVLAANTDKTYLRGLAEAGVPVVPTAWFPAGDGAGELPAWPELVVKPAVSAGARDTLRTSDRGAALEHLRAVQAGGRTVMVQPYLSMVEAEGETSLIYLDGRFSHAVRRGPMLVPEAGAPRWQVSLREPAADQRELAEAVLATVGEDLLYARVDLVRDPAGAPLLIELELTEPFLFLGYAEGAMDRFVAAVAARLR
jgi:glutathione synthase/RimK-type ligase-like ATP-grasp enzyme